MSIQNSWSLHIHLLLGWSEKPSLGERVKQTSVALTRTHQAYLVPLQVLRASHVWVLPQGSNELQGCHNDMWIQFEIGSWTMDASVSFISPLELYTAWVKHIQILLFQSEMHLHIIVLLYCQYTDNPSTIHGKHPAPMSWYGPTHFHNPLLWNLPKRVLTYGLLGVRALPFVDFKISMLLKPLLHTPFSNPLHYSYKMWLFHAWPMAFIFGSFFVLAFFSDFWNFSFLLSAISLARCRRGILFSSYFSIVSSPAWAW